LGAKVRAIKSVEPPCGKGTTSVTGLSGHAKALVSVKLAASVQSSFFMKIS
jgi:hypothetical protein